jgi:hypothetical protein
MSEYGGMVAIMAESVPDLKRILEEHYEREYDKDKYDIPLAISGMQSFDLAEGNYSPGVVREFIT